MEDYKKKYEDALKRAKKFIEENPLVQNLNTWIKETFPELAESEDEKIRKELIAWLQNTEGQVLPIDRYNATLAWLEKQGGTVDINPSEFDLRLNKLLKQFETLPKEELANSLSFYLNVVQNGGTYRATKKQGELDTIATEEVDFEKEWEEYFKYRGNVATVNIKDLAKHFFELGMKISNPIHNG